MDRTEILDTLVECIDIEMDDLGKSLPEITESTKVADFKGVDLDNVQETLYDTFDIDLSEDAFKGCVTVKDMVDKIEAVLR